MQQVQYNHTVQHSQIYEKVVFANYSVHEKMDIERMSGDHLNEVVNYLIHLKSRILLKIHRWIPFHHVRISTYHASYSFLVTKHLQKRGIHYVCYHGHRFRDNYNISIHRLVTYNTRKREKHGFSNKQLYYLAEIGFLTSSGSWADYKSYKHIHVIWYFVVYTRKVISVYQSGWILTIYEIYIYLYFVYIYIKGNYLAQ